MFFFMAYLMIQNGQLEIVPSTPKSHDVTIKNELGLDIQLRIVGKFKEASLYEAMPSNSTIRTSLYSGERVVIAWSKDDNIVLVNKLTVNRDGTLTLTAPQPRVIGDMPTLELRGLE